MLYDEETKKSFFLLYFFLLLRFNSLQGFKACVEKWRCNHHPHLTREDPRLFSANSISLSPISSVFSVPCPSPSFPVSSSSQGFFQFWLRPSVRDSKQCAFYQGKTFGNTQMSTFSVCHFLLLGNKMLDLIMKQV